MSDTLTIVRGLGDESYGYYVNNERKNQVSANDKYIIPDFYESLMLNDDYNITTIKKVVMNNEQADKVYRDHELTQYSHSHPKRLEIYGKYGEFDKVEILGEDNNG